MSDISTVAEPADPLAGRRCDFCGAEIVPGQHYLRGAALADTAGMERPFDVPEMIWDGIFDTPGCMASALVRDARDSSSLVYNIFGPR